MSEVEIIAKRRKVITEQIARLRDELTALEAELMELDLADSVLLRLSGRESEARGFKVYTMWRDHLKNSIKYDTHEADFSCSARQAVVAPKSLLFECKNHINRFAGGPGWDFISKKKPTLPEQITTALRFAHSQHVKALAPKDIEEYIVLLFGEAPTKQNVNSVVWRMASKGTLCKADGAPHYWLPEMNKAADNEPREGVSTALEATRAKGREAVPGGGT